MSDIGLVQILEGALLAADKPLTVAQLAELFEEHERPENAAIREALEEAQARCEDRGFELLEVSSGFRYQVRQSLAQWVGRLWHERPQKYSRALLETLALVAYRQPITRGEIEEIRGVAVSSNIIKTLHEREWIRVVGHRDVPGRPAMYATTRQFLDYFSLKTLDQLPALAEIRDLETLNAELGFSDPVPGTTPEQAQGAGSESGEESNPEADTEAETESDAAPNPELELESEHENDQESVDSSEPNPGLTVVGGTAHVAAATDDASNGASDDSGGETGGEATNAAITLEEAADDLEARAVVSETGDEPSEIDSNLDSDIAAADTGEEIDLDQEDYPDRSPSEPESQI